MNNIRINALSIIVHNDKILALKGFDENKHESFLRLLGGGVEFGETLEQALIREIKEELGYGIQNIKLLEVYENIFTFNSIPKHEITFLFKCNLLGLDSDSPIKIIDSEKEKFAYWIDLKEVQENMIKIYPEASLKYIKNEKDLFCK